MFKIFTNPKTAIVLNLAAQGGVAYGIHRYFHQEQEQKLRSSNLDKVNQKAVQERVVEPKAPKAVRISF